MRLKKIGARASGRRWAGHVWENQAHPRPTTQWRVFPGVPLGPVTLQAQSQAAGSGASPSRRCSRVFPAQLSAALPESSTCVCVCVCLLITSLCKGIVPFRGVGEELPCSCLPLARTRSKPICHETRPACIQPSDRDPCPSLSCCRGTASSAEAISALPPSSASRTRRELKKKKARGLPSGPGGERLTGDGRRSTA
jgi:hypothetical protein